MMALEWSDVNLGKRRVTVARSEWKGHVTATKGGRVRHLPLTVRLTQALKETRHLKGARVCVMRTASRCHRRRYRSSCGEWPDGRT